MIAHLPESCHILNILKKSSSFELNGGTLGSNHKVRMEFMGNSGRKKDREQPKGPESPELGREILEMLNIIYRLYDIYILGVNMYTLYYI